MHVRPQRRRADSRESSAATRAARPRARTREVAPATTIGNAAMGRLVGRGGRLIQRQPEIAATDAEMGQRVVDQVNAVNAPRTHATGVHYPHNYEANAKRAATDPAYKPYAAFWKDDYWKGYADPAYFDRTGPFAWQLKAGVSAAAAIKAWLKGPTIAECASVLIAIELNTMRAAVGDDRFDELFSDRPSKPAEKGRLRVSQSPRTSSAGAYMGGTNEAILRHFGKDTPGSRSVKKGEWYYFYNHPKYLLKHPGGAFQGENAICMDATPGKQTWAGFGVSPKTEGGMMEEMARAYSAPRTEHDYRILVEAYAAAAVATKGSKTWKTLYEDNLGLIPDNYRHDKGSYPDTVSASDILSAPAYTIGGVTRTGGFVAGGGKALSAAEVQAARTP